MTDRYHMSELELLDNGMYRYSIRGPTTEVVIRVRGNKSDIISKAQKTLRRLNLSLIDKGLNNVGKGWRKPRNAG